VIQLLVERGRKLEMRDRGSRDTHIPGAPVAGVTFQAIDYADGLVRSASSRRSSARGVGAAAQTHGSAWVARAAPGRTLNSICVVALCQGLPQ
jgi:hypothetical protein